MAAMYGYARVSTREQNLDRQLDALRAFGVSEGRVYADKASGKDFDGGGEMRQRHGRMERHNVTLTARQWEALCEEAERAGMRSASAVIQAHAEKLARRHARQDGRRS